MDSVKEEACEDSYNVEQIRVAVCCRKRTKLQQASVQAESTGTTPVNSASGEGSSRTEQGPDTSSHVLQTELNCEEGKVRLSRSSDSNDDKVFHFAHVFTDTSDQEDMHNTCCADMVQTAVDGGCSTIITYGTSRTGKSQTLFGSADGNDKGIIHFASQQIFSSISKLQQEGEAKDFFLFLFYSFLVKVLKSLLKTPRPPWYVLLDYFITRPSFKNLNVDFLTK